MARTSSNDLACGNAMGDVRSDLKIGEFPSLAAAEYKNLERT